MNNSITTTLATAAAIGIGAPILGLSPEPSQLSRITSYRAGGAPACVAIGDVDGNGLPDMIIANALGGSVSILLNDGEGTLAESVAYE